MNPEINNNIYLDYYKQRSVFDSNCVEFWGCIDDRIIPNIYPNRYYVSTFGRTYNTNTCKPFGLSMHRKGYYQYNFSTTDHKGVTRKLHRVIMFTFCYFPGCENYEINHIDGNKLNNAITNLEWCTSSENTIHAINLGLKTVFGNESAKVTLQNDDSVEEILYLYYCENYGPSEIIQIMRNNYNIEVGPALVNNICHGNSRLSYFNDRYGERSSTSGNTYSFKDYLTYKHNIRFANNNDFI